MYSQGYSQPFHGYNQPLQGYSQPLQGFGPTNISMNPQSALTAPVAPNSTIMTSPGMHIITGGNAGNIIVNPLNPRYGTDSNYVSGEICTKCGKGLVLLDMDMVRKGHGACLLMLVVFFPCVCCYVWRKKSRCTSCKEEFPNNCCT